MTTDPGHINTLVSREIEGLVARLAEITDGVVVCATWRNESGITEYRYRTQGNALTCHGMVAHYLDQDAATINAQEIGKTLNPGRD